MASGVGRLACAVAGAGQRGEEREGWTSSPPPSRRSLWSTLVPLSLFRPPPSAHAHSLARPRALPRPRPCPPGCPAPPRRPLVIVISRDHLEPPRSSTSRPYTPATTSCRALPPPGHWASSPAREPPGSPPAAPLEPSEAVRRLSARAQLCLFLLCVLLLSLADALELTRLSLDNR